MSSKYLIPIILLILTSLLGSSSVLAKQNTTTKKQTADIWEVSNSFITNGLIPTYHFPFFYSYIFSLNTSQASEATNSLASSAEYSEASETLYPVGTILAEFVDPRADAFSGFPDGECTTYIAKQVPDLFVNPDGTRRLTGNAEDWLRNAQRLGIAVGSEAKVGSIAVFREGRGGRKYGHVALVQDIQEDGTLIVSEMNFEDKYIITYRVIKGDLAAGYIYQ